MSVSIFFINSKSSYPNKITLFQTELSVSSDSKVFLELNNTVMRDIQEI